MFPYIALSLLALVALLLLIIALRPSTFTVRRALAISARPARVFAQLDDFHALKAWSPWEGIDPQAKQTFSGPTAGVGASYRWACNNKVGEGLMTITESRPGAHLGIDIEFFKPFAAKNLVTFDLATTGGGTTVTWSMSGKSGFMFKVMGLVMNCDKMIGDQYEQGLAKLKSVSESGAGAPASSPQAG